MGQENPSRQAPFFRETLEFSANESIGAREVQEDHCLFRTINRGGELLAVLADGMGGHACGEVASKIAVNTFDDIFNNYPADSVPTKLGAALQQANAELASSIKNSPALAGMGCTLVGIHIGDLGLQWISVGDSLLYLRRNGRITRLNADHSMAPVIEESLRKGVISSEEASSHPNRNALRSAVTGDSLSLIDTPKAPIPLCKGDVVVLASDGILTLTESEIASIAIAKPGVTADSIARNLISAVATKNKPRQDNTTIQVIIIPTMLGEVRGWPRSLWLAVGLITFLLLAFLGYVFFARPPVILGLLSSGSEKESPQTSAPQGALPTPTPTPTPIPKVTPTPTVKTAPATKLEIAPKSDGAADKKKNLTPTESPAHLKKTETLPAEPTEKSGDVNGGYIDPAKLKPDSPDAIQIQIESSEPDINKQNIPKMEGEGAAAPAASSTPGEGGGALPTKTPAVLDAPVSSGLRGLAARVGKFLQTLDKNHEQ